ncbi:MULTISPECIES: phosphatidate cytidylyltransferase [Mycetocola]|uniref:phosphatidate cytidylyltransferase n=1 Tax=Mycetocola TaxID=76634 RepID=UPI000A5D4A37|nr:MULTISPECIES: phosphatidate cytidylyltransferase [Mycetocola]MCS4275789.1 phosphatidate cytidylyltransferase [Mycetocola sp. BIGb0189]
MAKVTGAPGDPEPGTTGESHSSREVLHAQLKATRADIERKVQETRAQVDQVNERIAARTGRNLVLAILIGLGLGGVLLVSLIVIKDLFAILALAFVVFTTLELVNALRLTPRKVDPIPNVLAGAAMVVASYIADPVLIWSTLLGGIAVVVVWRLIAQMIEADERTAPEILRDVLVVFLVQVYVPLMASFAVLLTRQEHGEWWTLAFLIVVVSVDVGAYASGLSFGKHPMAPKISPKKTWEGLAGAAIAAQIAGILLAIFMLEVPFWVGMILGALLTVSATFGDLGESLIKRDIGIKDMSSWLPGHGGFLDRIDSMLPSAPLAFALFMIFSPLSSAVH